MKRIFLFLFLFGLFFPSFAAADLQGECGQYLDEYIKIEVQIRDVHQFQRENQEQIDRFPPGKLSPRQLEEHRRLREQNRMLHEKERDLQDRSRQARGNFTTCVENYKKTHTQSTHGGDEEPFDRAVNNMKRKLREMGIDPNLFSW